MWLEHGRLEYDIVGAWGQEAGTARTIHANVSTPWTHQIVVGGTTTSLMVQGTALFRQTTKLNSGTLIGNTITWTDGAATDAWTACF